MIVGKSFNKECGTLYLHSATIKLDTIAKMLRDSCRAYRYIIGLTGSIASGKSHAREYLASLGAVAIDADRMGHAAYKKGTPCYDAVVREFSSSVVGPDGSCLHRETMSPC